MVTIDPVTIGVIISLLHEKRLPMAICIEIRSSGCCDSSLGIAAGTPGENDIVQTLEDLTVAIDQNVRNLVGDITISWVDEKDRKGFMIHSEKPLNEWAGFTPGSIRFK
jgi:Fe-S cluster assembly iron-binding protein IscA